MPKITNFYMLFTMWMLIIMYLLTTNTLHPIIQTILLILYNIIICLMMSMWSFNYIFSIMLFLIMISGLLIIFLYFASLISNVQNKLNFNFMMTMNFLLNLLLLLYFIFSNLNNYTPHFNHETLTLNYMNSPIFQNISYMYLYPFNSLTLLCMFYLLITLFTIIKICSIKSSPMRKLK